MSRSDDLATEYDPVVDRIVDEIAAATPEIREAIAEHRQYTGSFNPSGEQQLAADRRADHLFEDRLLGVEEVGTYASEERADLSTDEGDLHVAMDPLDGSSNLQPNSGMGSIFGIYEERPPTVGRNLLASGFIIYGPITSMVVASDGVVREYVLEDGERRLVEDDVEIPEDPTVFGFGGGVDSWPDAFTEFAEDVRYDLKLRYGGAMIADVNQVVTYGGIFSYPALDDAPNGKLRLQFEGQPMAYVIETAGGRSSNGDRSLLDVDPSELHERTPLHLGSADLIEELEETLD